ncbi:MAG: energy-coupling factor transporter ATPase [Eubacteriaceae bacterium]|nr:energy-coupling factor transporter ATPase [Eubacteriaceae bacterium]
MMIQVRGVRYKYDSDSDSYAVDGIDLDLAQGEFVGIVGHNGSGKSTFAKMLNGLILPTEGSVNVLGMDTKDEKSLIQIRRNIGMVFQNPDNQIVATIVEEDVAFGVENLGIEQTKIRGIVDSALTSVGMYSSRLKKPHQLSGGQKQRVAIAGVLAMNPRCIILDESTAMLDPNGRAEVITTALRLNKEEGVTVVLITHYMEELVNADRIIAMENGKIAFDLPPAKAFSDSGRLRSLRLGVPEIVQIASILRENGIPIRENTLDVEGLVEDICQLK